MDYKLTPLKFFVFTFLILFICFIILEGLTRIYLLMRGENNESVLDALPMVISDKNRIFELKSNYHQEYISPEFKIIIKTNGDGLRDIEHAVNKSENVYRIIALGDSFTFGWGINQEDAWWKILENMLNNEDKERKYEIINLGVWMYTFDQQLLRLKDKGLKYKPDLVIQGIYWPHLKTIATHQWVVDNEGNLLSINDPTIYVNEDNLLKTKDKNILLHSLKKHSKLLNAIISRLQILLLRHRLISDDLLFLRGDSVVTHSDTWQKALESIHQTKEILAKKGINYVVFFIPRDVQVSKREWSPLYLDIMNDQLYQDEFPQKIFSNFFLKEKIPYLDLLSVFRKDYSPDLYYVTDPHWTKEGHRLAGEQIYKFIKLNAVGIK